MYESKQTTFRRAGNLVLLALGAIVGWKIATWLGFGISGIVAGWAAKEVQTHAKKQEIQEEYDKARQAIQEKDEAAQLQERVELRRAETKAEKDSLQKTPDELRTQLLEGIDDV